MIADVDVRQLLVGKGVVDRAADLAFLIQIQVIQVRADSAVGDRDPHGPLAEQVTQGGGLRLRDGDKGDLDEVPAVRERPDTDAAIVGLEWVARVEEHTRRARVQRVLELPRSHRAAEIGHDMQEHQLAAYIELGELLRGALPGVGQRQRLAAGKTEVGGRGVARVLRLEIQALGRAHRHGDRRCAQRPVGLVKIAARGNRPGGGHDPVILIPVNGYDGLREIRAVSQRAVILEGAGEGLIRLWRAHADLRGRAQVEGDAGVSGNGELRIRQVNSLLQVVDVEDRGTGRIIGTRRNLIDHLLNSAVAVDTREAAGLE